MDGRETRLYVANGSFKGVRVPAGPHVVEFRYGEAFWYVFQWVLIVMFNALFYGLTWSFWKSGRQA